jgi:hypothetical protein
LREISTELAVRGIMNERGQPFSPASINSMLATGTSDRRDFRPSHLQPHSGLGNLATVVHAKLSARHRQDICPAFWDICPT